jgi:hypothetical protein
MRLYGLSPQSPDGPDGLTFFDPKTNEICLTVRDGNIIVGEGLTYDEAAAGLVEALRQTGVTVTIANPKTPYEFT